MSFRFLSPQVQDPILDVVFVHGLRLFKGAPQTDWRPKDGDADSFWPEWLLSDLGNIRVGILSYEAWAFAGNGDAMHLEDRASNVLSEIRAEGIGKNPVVFIAHSLGGLVVKEMLLRAKDLQDFKAVADSCRGVAFLATPHYGSRDAKRILSFGRVLRPTAAIETLSDENKHLMHLTRRYRTWVSEQENIHHLVLHEALKTSNVMVVPAESSDPGIVGADPVAVDENHITIAAPTSRESAVYKNVKFFLREVIESLASLDTVHVTREPQRDALKRQFQALETRLLFLGELRADSMNERENADYLDATHLAYKADNALRVIDDEIETAQEQIRAIPYDIYAEVRADDARSLADEARANAERDNASADDDIWMEA